MSNKENKQLEQLKQNIIKALGDSHQVNTHIYWVPLKGKVAQKIRVTRLTNNWRGPEGIKTTKNISKIYSNWNAEDWQTFEKICIKELA
jgi:hypothetical protein